MNICNSQIHPFPMLIVRALTFFEYRHCWVSPRKVETASGFASRGCMRLLPVFSGRSFARDDRPIAPFVKSSASFCSSNSKSPVGSTRLFSTILERCLLSPPAPNLATLSPCSPDDVLSSGPDALTLIVHTPALFGGLSQQPVGFASRRSCLP